MKTLTMHVDDNTYDTSKAAADGQRRNISNFLEFITMQYLSSSQYIDSVEMQEILSEKDLVKNLKGGLEDFNSGDYIII